MVDKAYDEGIEDTNEYYKDNFLLQDEIIGEEGGDTYATPDHNADSDLMDILPDENLADPG